eukprot:2456927-Prymnesium_polylepis.1
MRGEGGGAVGSVWSASGYASRTSTRVLVRRVAVAYSFMAYDAPGGGIGRYARPAVQCLARGTCR